jgi:hypothetical protein
MESTFKKTEIEKFLELTNNNFAACCFFNDIREEFPTRSAVEGWFNRFFHNPGAGKFLFLLMECHCSQSIDNSSKQKI